MLSIVSLPADVLLEIFDCPELDLGDLKNLRLSHTSFCELAAFRLFQRLSLTFAAPFSVDTGGKTTTVTQRINSLVQGASTNKRKKNKKNKKNDPAERFQGVNFREFHVKFLKRERNGFATFTQKTAKKLLPLLGNLNVLRLEYKASPRYTSYGYGPQDSRLLAGLESFFEDLGETLREGMKVEEMLYYGEEPHLSYLQPITGLKVLKLTVQGADTQYTRRSEEAEKYPRLVEAIADIIVGNPRLEKLCLGYLNSNMDLTDTGKPQEVLGNVLDKIPASHDVGIKHLELRWVVLPSEPARLAKMKMLEDVSFPMHFILKDDPDYTRLWEGVTASGLKLKKIRRTTYISTALGRYLLAIDGAVTELSLSPQLSFDQWLTFMERSDEEKKARGIRDIEIRRLYSEEVMPKLGRTLVRLTLEAYVTALDDNPELESPLLPLRKSPLGTADSPPHACAGSFGHLMQLIRGYKVLKHLDLDLRARYSGANDKYLYVDDDDDEKGPGSGVSDHDKWFFLSLCESWTHPLKEEEAREVSSSSDWPEGLVLTMKRNRHLSLERRNYQAVGVRFRYHDFVKMRSVWVLEQRTREDEHCVSKGCWAFKPVKRDEVYIEDGKEGPLDGYFFEYV